MSSEWSIVAQVGFWGWLLATVGYILAVFPHRGTFLGRASLRWGIPLFLCYLVWVVGMLKA
jgi:hypothetical protein